MTTDHVREPTNDLVNGAARGIVSRNRVSRRTARVRYNGITYERDLARCRQALTEREVAGDIRGGISGLVIDAGVCRATITRFFAGYNVSMRVTLGILGALKLDFETVHTVVSGDGRDRADADPAGRATPANSIPAGGVSHVGPITSGCASLPHAWRAVGGPPASSLV